MSVWRRRLLTAAGLALLLAVLAAHWAWHYAPRVRAARPAPDDLPARLLAAGELPVALWIPYPHQNLGSLEAALGSGRERRDFLAAAARLAELPPPSLPRFGPFPAPPARELVALSDETGDRVLVAARVYPLLAVVAKLAGRVAGNPWLAGGPVEAFGGAARVEWDGSLWTAGNVLTEDVLLPAPPVAGEGTAPPAAVAALRLARPVSFLPAGTLRLRRRDGGYVVAGDDDGGAPEPPAPPPDADLALLVVSGPGGPLERRGGGAVGEAGSGDGRGALALFASAGGGDDALEGVLDELLGGLPAAAAWYLPGGERFRLPGERLLGSSRRGAAAGNGERWEIVATSRGTVARAEELTPLVAALAGGTSLALVAAPGPALDAVDRVTGVLELVPLVSRDEVARWRDWHTVLSPLAPFDRLLLWSVVEPGGDASRLRLELRRGPPRPAAR